MAKISPVSIKYMIHAEFVVEGYLEKPDVIGALFGQTEGLLGSELEMRELQKEGKIGRIEVDLERKNKRTMGKIKIPTDLDQSETSLIAAAIETIERIGPCDSQITIEKIEDVRGSKREYIVDRAKNLMRNLQQGTSTREISNEIKTAAKIAGIEEYGPEKLSCGDLSENEIIVVEGRADVLNLIRNGVTNVISMNGTKLPESISKMGEEKDLILFVDGDRAGKLIIQNVLDNAKIKYIVIAPSGKEVEELTGKEILQALRKKIPSEQFLLKENRPARKQAYSDFKDKSSKKKDSEVKEITEEDIKTFYNQVNGTGKALLVGRDLNNSKSISIRGVNNALKNPKRDIRVILIDGTATKALIENAENAKCDAIAAKNFATTDTKMKLFGF